MKRLLRLVILMLAISPWVEASRDDALKLAVQAHAIMGNQPLEAARLGVEAYELLDKLDEKKAEDLRACAAIAARAYRMAGDFENAVVWFKKGIEHGQGVSKIVLQAELSDVYLKAGDLAHSFSALGAVNAIPLPSAELAQWWQTRAKIELSSGMLEAAENSTQQALKALAQDDVENRGALHIDLAGIYLRAGKHKMATQQVSQARLLLGDLENLHPEMLSALAMVESDLSEVNADQSYADLLATRILLNKHIHWKKSPAALSFDVGIAAAALRAGKKEEALVYLRRVIKAESKGSTHPLLVRAHFLAAECLTGQEKDESARRSSQMAFSWLEETEFSHADAFLGLQKTVDAVSPLLMLDSAPTEEIADAVLRSQNYALRKRLGKAIGIPQGVFIQFFLYEKRNASSHELEKHYAAVIYGESGKDPQLVKLGKVSKIHRRISAAILTAERTLGNQLGSETSLEARLEALWKSIWEPLLPYVDDADSITLSPAGLLHFVPWSVLRRKDGKHLCQLLDDLRIVSLAYPERRALEFGKRLFCGIERVPGRDVFAHRGWPFDNELLREIDGLGDLPGVKLEEEKVKAVGKWVKYDSTAKSIFQKTILSSRPDVLHLAGHGFVVGTGEASGFRAGFVMGDDVLFASEIAAIDFSFLDLVVLSLCRGGLGQEEVNGNWSSLRKSFIAAGATSVLAAQWRVRDDDIPEFMQDFYFNVEKKMPVSQALWRAQRDWMTKESDQDLSVRLASAGAWLIEF